MGAVVAAPWRRPRRPGIRIRAAGPRGCAPPLPGLRGARLDDPGGVADPGSGAGGVAGIARPGRARAAPAVPVGPARRCPRARGDEPRRRQCVGPVGRCGTRREDLRHPRRPHRADSRCGRHGRACRRLPRRGGGAGGAGGQQDLRARAGDRGAFGRRGDDARGRVGPLRHGGHRALLDRRSARRRHLGAGGPRDSPPRRPAPLPARPCRPAGRRAGGRAAGERVSLRHRRPPGRGGAGGGAAARRDPGGRAHRERGSGTVLGLVRRTRRRPRDPGVPRPARGSAAHGAGAGAAPARSPLARGSRAGGPVQSGAPEQVPARAHGGAETGCAGGARLRPARGAEEVVRAGDRGREMTRRVLLSGGAGFVGSHVAEAYLAAGDEVTVLDDLSTGRRENLPRGVRFVHADIRSAEARDLLAQGRFELLNHHAAQMDVRRSVADPLFDLDVNLRGLLNLLEGARAGGVRRVVFASSGGVVYGDATAPPCREGAAKLPISPYGVAKLASEHYLMAYSRLYGLDVASLRYSNVYGPRQNAEGEAGVVAIFSRKMLAGELRRSALAVEKAGHELGWAPRTGLADGLGVTLRSLAED